VRRELYESPNKKSSANELRGQIDEQAEAEMASVGVSQPACTPARPLAALLSPWKPITQEVAIPAKSGSIFHSPSVEYVRLRSRPRLLDVCHESDEAEKVDCVCCRGNDEEEGQRVIER
jgi:hypothetical protein